MTKRKPTTLMLFSNGQFACFDADNWPIVELQLRTAIELWAEYAAEIGYDPEGCEVRTQLPGGDGPRCEIAGELGEYWERWL